MSVPLPLEFLRSASSVSQLPESKAEIALVGRSNVGKSTLINSLANRKKLAKTSKTPGATQLINVYELGEEGSGYWLVDLPGYGYAKMPANVKAKMAKMINEYLEQRDSIRQIIQLFDANVGPTALDLQTLDWLGHIDFTVLLVGTKIDKIKPSQRGKKQRKAAEALGVRSGDIHWVSAQNQSGIETLRSQLHTVLHS